MRHWSCRRHWIRQVRNLTACATYSTPVATAAATATAAGATAAAAGGTSAAAVTPLASALALADPSSVPGQDAAARPVHTQVSQRLSALAEAANGVHRLSVQLHPQDLGAVQVVAVLADGRLHLQLTAGSDAARDALRASLADLRHELSSAGLANDTTLDLSERGFGAENTGERSATSDQGGAQHRSTGGAGGGGAWTAPVTATLLPTHAGARHGRALDVRV